jgi:multicomponent Na+:H+ antiporter subunit G
MNLAVDVASWGLILLGSFFTVAGAFGVVRMPDVFTRIHAAGVTDTLGVGLLLLGMCLQSGFSLVTMKLLFLLGLFFFTAPVVAHALSQACLHENIKPILAEDRRGAGRPQPESSADSAREGRRS